MKTGTVIIYDGSFGEIESTQGTNYIFIKDNIETVYNLTVGDMVVFRGDSYYDSPNQINTNIATFIKKIDKPS